MMAPNVEHDVVISNTNVNLSSDTTNYNLDFGISINPGGSSPGRELDYNKLKNKPSINNITL